MPHVSLRVTEEERNTMEGYAKMLGVNISEAIKGVFFQRLEDEFDLQHIWEHRANKAKGAVRMYSLDEAAMELGLDDV